MKPNKDLGTEHKAFAKMTNLAISTKHSVQISRYIRYKNVTFAKNFLEDVVAIKKAVPFRRFNRDLGHKAGMAAGRYPKNAAQQFLHLLKSVESNAQDKGLNTSNLKIVKILANKASIPQTGGRTRQGTKRTHLEVMVKEGKTSEKKSDKKVAEKKEATTPKVKAAPEVKEEAKAVPETKPEPVVEEKPEVKEEAKPEVSVQ